MSASSVMKLCIALAVFCAGVSAGSWVTSNTKDKQIAAIERDWAQQRAEASNAGLKAERKTTQTVIKQAKVKQEVDHDAIKRRSILDERLADERLRNRKRITRCYDVPTLPAPTTEFASAASQSAPIEAGRSAGALPSSVEENAARDAQQLAELIDALYRLENISSGK